MDQVGAVFPDVEVVDFAGISTERILLSERAAWHGIAVARYARVGRVRKPGEAHRGVVDEEKRHGFRRRWRFGLHIGCGGVTTRGYGNDRGEDSRRCL